MKYRLLLGRLRALLQIYHREHISMAAAALSYFLTLSFFPMLICLYTMLGGLFPQTGEIVRFLRGVLPSETLGIITDYLIYVSDHMSNAMLVMALLVLASSSSAAFRTIARVIGDMWGVPRRTGLIGYLFSFCFSLAFLFAVYITIVLMVSGKWFLEFVDRHIWFMNISDSWQWIRFLLLFLLLFVMLSGVYRITVPARRGLRLMAGAALASLALVAVSIVFSSLIGASIKYPLVYGSLASVIIMMFWLYICGIVLFFGNAVLMLGSDFQ